ncbi:MAG: beta strand repeat-containing protein [Gemmataceae bacterium]
MFHMHWLHNFLVMPLSRKDRRRRAPRQRRPVRLTLESLEERLTPSGPQTAGSYTDLVNAVAADTAANTNYVIDITQSFKFNSGGQVSISKLGSGSTLTIEGQNGTNFTLTGNGTRLFEIAKGQNVTLEDLTLTGGSGVNSGGGILDQGGKVTLSKVAVQGNTVKGYADGGGVSVTGDGNLTIKGGSTIKSNHAIATGSISSVGDFANSASGGGLYVSGASTVLISGSAISNNSAQGAQGANGATPGAAGISGGRAEGGGMVVVGSGWNVTLSGDTFSGNSAIGGAGGNGAAGSNASGSNASGGNGGAGGYGGLVAGGAAVFGITTSTNSGGSGTLTILNAAANSSMFIDNSAEEGAGGNGGNGGNSTGTANNSNGGDGGASLGGQGGAVWIASNSGATLTVNIGNTTFYGNTVAGGNGGGGGAAGTGGSGTAGMAGTAGVAGGGSGGGLFLGLSTGNDASGNVTMFNSTVAKNTVTGGGSGGGISILYPSSGTTPTVVLDNNTITQNTISGNQLLTGSGAGFYITDGGNPTLVNNLMQGNQSGSSSDDLFTITASGSANTLTAATNNFIGTISTGSVSTTTNIVGNTTAQLGSVVGVDSKGNLTGGPVYYPLLSGVVSINAGSTSVLSTIAGVEGTTSANAVDEIGNPRSSNGSIGLGAIQVQSTSTSAPTITTQPTNQSAAAGGNVSFTASASGNPTPTVQWQVSSDGGTTFSNISGATSTTLTLNQVSTSMNGAEYRAVFSNSAGSASSNAATLTVNKVVPPPPPPPSPTPVPSPSPSPTPTPPALSAPPLLALFDQLLGGIETVNADGSVTVTDNVFGFPLLVANFSPSGGLESVTLFGINVTFLFELL